MDIKKETRKDKVDLSLLEEEDELEEFPVQGNVGCINSWLIVELLSSMISNDSPFSEWQGQPEDEDLTIWEDNWDDDNIEDDFCKQLK